MNEEVIKINVDDYLKKMEECRKDKSPDKLTLSYISCPFIYYCQYR